MTTTFQPGQHPDADQLNAFVEHALPPHEQQAMLAHLAVCPDCRAIAYLAQPPAPEHLPHPAPARTPLFARWMILWPTAAALACLLILTIHIHNATVARQQTTAVNTAQLEQASTPPAPPAPPTSAPTQAEKTPAEAAPPPHTLAKSGPAHPAVVPLNGFSMASAGTAGLPKPEMAAAANAPAEKKSAPEPTMAGAFYSANGMAAASPTGAAGSPQPMFHGTDAGRRELRSAATQYDLSRAQAQQAPPALPPPPSASSNSGIYGGTGQTNLNANYVEGVPVPNISAQAADTAAANAAAVDELSATADATVTLKAKRLPTLPSNLPALSVATNAGRQLAIDTAGALFLSQDAGATWQPVPAQWTGRAIKVALVPTPNAHLFAKSVGALSAPAAAAKAPAPQPPTFQLTTDSGTLWVSTDGQTWKQK